MSKKTFRSSRSLLRRSLSRLRHGTTAAVILATASIVTPAQAHHVMDGKLPTTFMQGLMSGLGHPVIGPDHLAFIVAVGIAASLLVGGSAVIAAFIGASTAGVIAHLASIDLPVVEAVVASSVVLAGVSLALASRQRRPVWLVLAAIAGLFHGYAFGESIVGAERTVVGAYLIGLALVSALIASVAMLVSRRLMQAAEAPALGHRVIGSALGAFGIVLFGLRFIG